MPRHTTELQERIVNYLVENGPSTAAQMSEALDIDYMDVRTGVMKLEGRIIRRAGWLDDRRLWTVIR